MVKPEVDDSRGRNSSAKRSKINECDFWLLGLVAVDRCQDEPGSKQQKSRD